MRNCCLYCFHWYISRNDCTRILELAGQACQEKNQGKNTNERYSAFIDEDG
jgi:hypothetical protein